MIPLSRPYPSYKHTASINYNEDILSQNIPRLPSPLTMHPIYPEDQFGEFLHPVQYEERPNPERVDIILPPSPAMSGTPIPQPSPNELEPLHTVTPPKDQSEAKGTQQTPPTIPPKDPRRAAKKKKRNWLQRFCEKLVSKLTITVSDERAQLRH